MKDTLTPFNRDDFRQRYKNNYGFLSRPEGRRLVYIKEVTHDRVTFLVDDGGNEYYAKAGTNVVFDFLPIVRGWYPTNEKAVFLTRIPARQYHRGISQNNTYIGTPDYGMLHDLPLSLEILSELFETPVIHTFEEFESGLVNYYILSKAFCLCQKNVYFFNQVVGQYEGRTITLSSPLVQQEINDVIRRENLPLLVKVNNADT